MTGPGGPSGSPAPAPGNAVPAPAAIAEPAPAAERPLVEDLPIAVYTTDADGFVTQFNQAAAVMWGREPVLGVTRWSGAVQVLQLDGMPLPFEDCPMAQVIRTRRAVPPTELVAVRPDGGLVPFIAHPTPLIDESGALTGAVNVLVDISTRKAAENEMKLGQQRLQLALDVGRMGLWDWYPETGSVVWSPGHYTLLGYAVGEITPSYRAWADRVHPDDLPRVEALVAQSLASRAPYQAEYRAVLPDGSVLWLESQARFDAEAENGRARMIGIIRDVTARKHAAVDLERVQQDRMRVSRLSAMGAMASTLAHELNQPLATAVNYLAAARRIAGDDVPPLLAEAVEHASVAVMRAGEIIRRIRRYTVDGEVSGRPEAIETLIAAAWAGLERRPDFAGVAFDCRLDPEAPRVLADAVQIEQVLSNLLRNALEACVGVPAPRVTIDCRRRGDLLDIAIADNGRGMDDDTLSGLFREFATTKPDGIGLGLAICRTIVESHRGQLKAGHRPGGGAIFTMSLPVAP